MLSKNLIISALAQLVYSVNECDDVFDRRFRKNAVSEIEDVSRSPFGSFENSFRLLAYEISIGEERDRIKIAHDRHSSESPPRVAQINAPVESDNVPSCFTHQFKKGSCASSEM